MGRETGRSEKGCVGDVGGCTSEVGQINVDEWDGEGEVYANVGG